MKTEIREKTDQMLIDKAAKSDRDLTHFHPSSFGGCKVAVWFELTGVRPLVPLGANKTRLFDNGHFVHLRHQLYCRDAGVLAKERVADVKHRSFTLCEEPLERINVIGESGRNYPFALDESVWFGVECKEDAWKVAGHAMPELKRVDQLEKNDEWWLAEVPFLDERYHFGGHCDAIVIDRGERVVIDWKGTNDYSIPYAFYDEDKNSCYASRYPDKFNSQCFICGAPMDAARQLSEHLMTKHEDEASPDWKHVVQLQIYMWQFDLQRAILVHENKNNQLLMDQSVDRNDGLIEGMMERADELWAAARSNERPDRPSKCKSRKNLPCKNCDFVSQCWE